MKKIVVNVEEPLGCILENLKCVQFVVIQKSYKDIEWKMKYQLKYDYEGDLVIIKESDNIYNILSSIFWSRCKIPSIKRMSIWMDGVELK